MAAEVTEETAVVVTGGGGGGGGGERSAGEGGVWGPSLTRRSTAGEQR